MAKTKPSNTWQSYKLGEMAEEVRNLFEPSGAREYPYIGLEHIDQGTLQLNSVGQSTDTVSTKKQFNAGEILFGSLRPYFRKVVRPKFNGVCSTDITVIRPKKNCNTGFLQYFIANQAFIDHATNISSGTRMPRANWKTLCESEWQFPPFSTQRKIATILSAYDDLIENNLRRIKILEEMAQNLYREWFVKFRFPGHQHARFIDSPLGRKPERWEVVNFGELYWTSSGGTPSRKIAEFYGGVHPWIKTRELNDGFILETEETITDLGLQKSSAKLFPENTVILAIYGATIGKLGILSLPSATNQACVAILPKEVGFGRAFAFLFLRENRDNLIRLGQGAAQQNISQEVLKKFPVLRPQVSLMQEFSVMVEPLFENVRNMQQKNTTLRRTRDLLLPKLISGEVDVSELDIAISAEEKV